MPTDLRWTTTLWHASHRLDSFGDLVEKFRDADHEQLAHVAANDVLNDWCQQVADYSDHDQAKDPHGHGKRLPYIGWYWRAIDFARKDIPVGDCGDFIGFMANNKWGYPARDLTPEECDHVIGLLWRARAEASKGGNLAELNAARDAVLTELWDWMQDLTGLKGWDE